MGQTKKWLVFAVLLSLVAVSVMTACAEPAPTRVTLTAQLSGGPKRMWDALIPVAVEKFEDENPNIELEVNYEVCEAYPEWAETYPST